MIWKKYKEVLVVLVFLALMALVYFFVISRLVAEIGNNKNRLREVLAVQENQQKRLADLPHFKKNFEELEAGEKKIKPFWEKSEVGDRGVEFIQEVEKLAEETGNTVAIEVINSENPSNKGAKDAPETIASGLPLKDYVQFKIKINGTFFSLLKILNKLENSEYYLDITSLQISRNQDAQKEAVPEPAVKNPFDEESPVEGNSVEIQNEQTAALINVVVYTYTKGKK